MENIPEDVPDNFVRDAEFIGRELAERTLESTPVDGPVPPEARGLDAVEQLSSRINDFDESLRSQRISGSVFEWQEGQSSYVSRFLALHRDRLGQTRDRLALLRWSAPERFDDGLIPIDMANVEAVRAILARAENLRTGPRLGARSGRPAPAASWDQRAEDATFVEMRSRAEVTHIFFQRFTLSFWLGRRSIAKTGQATVHFTVDCSNHGYQLEYWPQFLYRPKVFGGRLTRPVSATIPVNHYHFQGWQQTVLTPDNGLYQADANNTRAMLRAF